MSKTLIGLEALIRERYGSCCWRIEWKDRAHDVDIHLSDDGGVTPIVLGTTRERVRVVLAALPVAKVRDYCQQARDGRW